MVKPSFRPFLQHGIFNELDSLLHPGYAALSNKREPVEYLQFVSLPSHKLLLCFSTSIVVSPVPSFLHLLDLPALNADGPSTLQAMGRKAGELARLGPYL